MGPAASLSPDPSTVTFASDGAWHRFTVDAAGPVTVVANPAGTTPRLEITTRSGRSNFCPAEADDDVSRQDGQSVYLAGCATGTATVELRRPSDGTVLNTYTFEVTGSPADLVVESASVSDSTLTPGQSFTLRATVRNQGTGQSAATTLRYYRSSNRTISTRDTQVGTDAVGTLGASRTSAESIRLTAPSSEGTYYYGACVVSVSESNTRNNCSAGIRVTVEASSPDLVVESVSVSENSLTTGQSFTLNAAVRNQGMGASVATTLRYYRSTNTTITTRDTQVGTDPVGPLAASGTSAESISLTAPSSEGTYYYGACVAGVSNESDTGNNCSRGVRVTVARASSGFAPADQAAFNSRMVGKRLHAGGWYLDFVSAGRFSEDGSLPGSYSYSNTGSNTGLLEQTYDGGEYGGACEVRLTFDSETAGTYTVTCDSGAEVQGTWSVAEIEIGAPRPELEFTGIDRSSVTLVVNGPTVTITFTLTNTGDAPSEATSAGAYLSGNSTISRSDNLFSTVDDVPALQPGDHYNLFIDLGITGPVPDFYVGYCVDAVPGEGNPSNNCSDGVPVTTIGSGKPVAVSEGAWSNLEVSLGAKEPEEEK